MDNKLKIINYLGKHLDQNFTMHELSNLVAIPYATFYRVLRDMVGLVDLHTVGKAKVVKLNITNKIIKSYLAISSEEEKNQYLEKHTIIKKIISEFQTDDVVVLFGSYAKGTQKKDSDIDLMIINESGKKDIFFSKYELLFKIRINPIFLTIREFKSMIKEKDENVGKQAVKYNIILNNPELFWGCILNG